MAKVSVNSLKGKLRLVWSYSGKRYFMHTGLSADDRVNWLVCESKAKQIEADIATNNFDKTLQKYKDEASGYNSVSVVQLFEDFAAWKGSRVYRRTLEKYQGLSSLLHEHFRNRSAQTISELDAMKFKDALLDRLASSTTKERIGLLNACWEWAISTKRIDDYNPWQGIRVRVPPKPKPRPFTRDEVPMILKAFADSPYYSHYLDYVTFLFTTGVRIGEAIGLQWDHVEDDCSQVWIGQSYSRGDIKETKTNEARTLTLPSLVRNLLLNRRQADGEGIVFKSPSGGYIDDHNFRNRAWKKSLERAGVEYRKPYLTRSTFISHALAKGMNPVDVADLTGHDVETLYREYAASIESSPKVPELDFISDNEEEPNDDSEDDQTSD